MMALPAADADALELYRYFPSFVKYRDSEAGVDANGEAILQKITYVLEKESGAHAELIRRLLYNLDPNNCETRFLDYLAFIFGEKIPGDWSDEKRRWFLRQLPDLLKLKGLHLGFERRAAFAGRLDAHAVELFKSIVNETCDYSDERDAGHIYRAARINITGCLSCQAYCQAGCEEGYVQVETMPSGEAKELVEELGEVLPVNVLVREDCATWDPSSPMSPLSDTMGCSLSCEYSGEAWSGSEIESDWGDKFSPLLDHFLVIQECVSQCEAACQTCCECQDEVSPCATGCEVNCQVSCEYTCQTDCMATCMTGCQAGACQWGCEVFEEL